MITVKILSSFRSQLYSDFYPFYRWEAQLKEQGIAFKAYSDYKDKGLRDADTILIFNRYLRSQLKENAEIIEYLIDLKKTVRKIIWFDAADSSGTMDFSIIPYVDIFLKKQVLRDLDYYTGKNGNKNVRIWLDPNAKQIELTPCPANMTHKIKVSWNLSYFDYRPYNSRLKYLISNNVGDWFFPNRFYDVSQNRPLDLTFRGKMKYDNENQISAQRNKVFHMLDHFSFNVAKGGVVSRKQYLKELSISKVSISPFGWGEVCYRDFETFICGAILIKPSMEHVITFPNIFIENETYIPVRWDLSDLQEKAEDVIQNYESYRHIAQNGQELFKEVLNDADSFVKHIKLIVE